MFSDLRRLDRPKGPRTLEKSIRTETPQAFVYCGFYAADETNVADSRALEVAARILSTRMVKEIREEAQLVYSIGTSFRPGSTYPGFGTISASSPTDPAKAATLLQKIASMYAALAENGVTDDELSVAKKQFANTLDSQLREPSFWLGRLARMTFDGTQLDDVVQAPEAYQAITADQLRATFARYYGPQNTVAVVVKPEPE